MNHDEQNPQMPNQIPAELEARLVAWVSGEALPAEAAALELLAAGNPEVAALKRRLEAARKLAAAALAPDAQPLRLSPDRRAALLKTLAEAAAADLPAPEVAVLPSLGAVRRKQARERNWIMAAAACLTRVDCSSGLRPLAECLRLGEEFGFRKPLAV